MPPAPGAAIRPPELLYRLVPALDALRTYSLRSLRLDVFAGLTVAAVAVPQAMAYASLAGLPPRYGLYTAIVMTAVGALFDSSRQLINGPTNAIAIAVFSALAFVPEEGRPAAAFLLALMVGTVQTAITLFRLGDLTRYVSHAVIVGFTLGAATLLVLGQIRHLLGLPAVGHGEEHFLVRLAHTLSQVGQTSLPTVAVGAGTIALVLALRWFGQRVRAQLPDLLLAIIGASAAVWLFDLHRAGVHIIGEQGEIPAALPSFALPVISWGQVRELSGSALAIALLGLLEAIAMAKAIAARTGQKLDINQQCLSEGLANLVGSFFQCFPGSGSLTRSTINVQAGAVSQWSGVFAAVAVAATVLLFAPLAGFIPRAALAGVLVLSASRLVDRKQLLYHLRATRFDAVVVLLTALSAVAISVEFCILIGVFLSFVMYVPRAARIHLSELVLTPERVLIERPAGESGACGRILIFSLEGELFFGSGPELDRHFETIGARAAEGARVVVLRVKRVRNLDAVCLDLLDRFVSAMEKRGVRVLLCGVRDDVAAVLRSSGLEDHLGAANIFRESAAATSSTLDAVRHAYDLLGDDLCATCPRRGELGKDVLYYMI